MRRAFWAAAAMAAMAAGGRAEDPGEPLWIRYPAISPDGSRVCFSYKGDLWTVPAEGGEARRITVHEACDRAPVWSPDGRTIAFQSDRHGNFDVFVVPASGGAATRLTFHSAHDRPCCFARDGRSVVFASARLDAPQAMTPALSFGELYSVPVAGGRPTQLLTTPAELAQVSPDGRLVVYQDRKGYENEWRKHHRSSVTRDLWVWDPADGSHRRLTDSTAEDRNPVWSPDGRSVLWLSEESGTSNVWRRAADGSGAPEQVTRFEGGPVRFLSVSDSGVLCFAWDGGLWTLAPGGEPRRLAVRAVTDDHENAVRAETLRAGATSFAVSPDEKEVAFVVRGEVFVASVDHGTTRRVTSTPEQERTPVFAPDGRTLYYAAERGRSWGIRRSSIVRAEEPNFFVATALREEPVLVGEDEVFQPAVSPDGSKLAFLRDRDGIEVLDLATGATRVLVPPARNASYTDGDVQFEWSPDSKWLAFTYCARARWVPDVGVVEVATGRTVDMTDSGYEEWAPRWSPDSRALFFASDRLGRRSHGSWGSDADVFALYLTQESHDRAALSREEFDLLEGKDDGDEEKDGEKGRDGGKDRGGRRKDRAKDKPPEPVKIEFDRLEKRVRRATISSAPLGGYAVSPDGEAVVYFAKIGDKWDLWITRPRDHKTVRALDLGADGAGDVVFGREGRAVYVRKDDGGIVKVELGGLLEPDGEGQGKPKPVAYAAEMTVDAPAERAYVFEHAWRQTLRKFYDPKLHGVDWEGLKAQYARLLPHVTNNWDFAELLSEMLGELNASHTGAGYRPKREDADRTAALGLLWDPAWTGDGLRVAEVVAGGPCAKAGSRLAPGVVVTAVDGVALTASVDPAAPLNRRQDKNLLLDLRGPDGATWQEVVKPVSLEAEANLLYERWVERCRRAVAEASGGRVGYVHVRGMNEDSFRRTYSEVLGRNSDCEALVVDTRFNGGGWLHDDLCGFLGGRVYLDVVPRGKARGDLGSEPFARWTRPVAVLMSEGNYSDAHVFPYAFRALGLGKLVGAPVAGTGTAVWWETQIDPTIVFGIPEVGLVTPEGRYLENQQLDPDVPVALDPQEVARGRDAQLLKAVEVALEGRLRPPAGGK